MEIGVFILFYFNRASILKEVLLFRGARICRECSFIGEQEEWWEHRISVFNGEMAFQGYRNRNSEPYEYSQRRSFISKII